VVLKGFMSFLKISVTKEWTEHTTRIYHMEIYVAYKDYNWMMKFAEDLLEYCAVAVNGTSETTLNIK
jgi:lysyl-tRNA synthetase class II